MCSFLLLAAFCAVLPPELRAARCCAFVCMLPTRFKTHTQQQGSRQSLVFTNHRLNARPSARRGRLTGRHCRKDVWNPFPFLPRSFFGVCCEVRTLVQRPTQKKPGVCFLGGRLVLSPKKMPGVGSFKTCPVPWFALREASGHALHYGMQAKHSFSRAGSTEGRIGVSAVTNWHLRSSGPACWILRGKKKLNWSGFAVDTPAGHSEKNSVTFLGGWWQVQAVWVGATNSIQQSSCIGGTVRATIGASRRRKPPTAEPEPWIQTQ